MLDHTTLWEMVLKSSNYRHYQLPHAIANGSKTIRQVGLSQLWAVLSVGACVESQWSRVLSAWLHFLWWNIDGPCFWFGIFNTIWSYRQYSKVTCASHHGFVLFYDHSGSVQVCNQGLTFLFWQWWSFDSASCLSWALICKIQKAYCPYISFICLPGRDQETR